MTKEKEIRISVRDLVEYAHRSGDLDSRFAGMGKAQEGARLHQKIQGVRKEVAAKDGETYRKEVSISKTISCNNLTFIISGRIDGLVESSKGITLEEIKTTVSPLEYIEEDTYPVHWAQAKCYAYMYASEYQAAVAQIQLTYYNTDSGELKVFVKPVEMGELEEYFMGVLEKYYKWAFAMYEWSNLRDSTIKSLEFPYNEYRKNQRKLAVAVYKTIEASKRIFIQAPTGTGKTISALFPAIKALGEGNTSRIFYLTAKTITRQVAIDAISRMWERGLRLKAIVLTAKEKICFREETNCNPEYCEYARQYTVCPFELSLDLAYWMDCIICDYNYVFDPRASLKRFFLEKESDYVLLIDEAHNLVYRAREMFSAELNKKPFLEMLQQPTMQEEEKESFLQCFQQDTETGLVAFAVMGGVFSEGIDLVGDRLVGAVIVGVGLPQVCFERDIIMEFFKNKNSMGFEYAYMYPGMNKVMQAAGRVIRSELDRGVVLLIDERFGSNRYTSMFPQEWLHNNRVKSPEELGQILGDFWGP
ncbi:MAG: helicase C-terminal domain-containing protein [Clostridia bacterium]